ncbi:MAG: Tn7 transposase TnsA N-terminal domain-containing protein [Acidobacteria bacterium]|nr:Tn7 transposase TnsA N-terminal domain-containing protein [Acidobacteriota bacterium]
MLSRKISNRGGRKVISLFPTRHDHSVWCESLNELYFAHLLDIDPDILDFEEQPSPLHYSLEGKRHRHTPDFLAKRKTGKYLYQVKPHEVAITAEWQEKFRAIAVEAKRQGYEFEVITDRWIKQEPRLSNVQILRRYCTEPFTEEHRLVAIKLFATYPQITLGGMRAGFEHCGFTKQSLYAMIYHGLISLPLEHPISDHSNLTSRL